MPKPTKEQLQDELILAKIIAGGMASGRKVLPHSDRDGVRGSRNGYGVAEGDDTDGPCCAVGAGILFAGLTIVDGAIGAFAYEHGVSSTYAQGVSHGFEDTAILGFNPGPDYYRGLSVGNAAFEFFTETGRG